MESVIFLTGGFNTGLTVNDIIVSSFSGQLTGFFNLSYILSNKNMSIQNAYYDDNKAIRTIAVARKFKVLTVVLHANMNGTAINFSVEYGKVNHTKQVKHVIK